jgi:hypothetical protein
MPVSMVRILELLVWCAVEPQGYYRRFDTGGVGTSELTR